MKIFLLLMLTFAFTPYVHSQSIAQRIDDSLKLVDKQTKFHSKRVPKQEGMTFFNFKKNNNELFSIVDIKGYRNSNGTADSSVSMGFIYNKERLVKANCIRHIYNQKDKKLRGGIIS